MQTVFSASSPAKPASASFTPGSRSALGMRFKTAVAGDLSAIRFLKGLDENSTSLSAYVIDWATGTTYASVLRADTSSCGGGKWVSLSIKPPLRTVVGTEYLVYLDGLRYFPRSDNYYTAPVTSGSITVTGSSSGPAGAIPWDIYWQASCYFIDGE